MLSAIFGAKKSTCKSMQNNSCTVQGKNLAKNTLRTMQCPGWMVKGSTQGSSSAPSPTWEPAHDGSGSLNAGSVAVGLAQQETSASVMAGPLVMPHGGVSGSGDL